MVLQDTIGPEEPIKVKGAYVQVGNHSRDLIPMVDTYFINTHTSFSNSIQCLELSKKISLETLLQPSTSSADHPTNHIMPKAKPAAGLKFGFSAVLSRCFLRIWLLFPNTIRVAAYDMLRKLGTYERDFSKVQRLPFGLYLKYHADLDCAHNEYNALSMARCQTSVPAPTPLDIVLPKPPNEEIWLLMTRMPGLPLCDCFSVISDANFEQIANQMKDYVGQLRAIPKTVNPEMAICNTVGKAIQDARIRWGDPFGPLADEESFSRLFRFWDEPSRRGHSMLFTHGDLNPRNILVESAVQPNGYRSWRVTGIVDWEFSGFFPEYWEFTKAMFEGFRWPLRYNDVVKQIFHAFGDYSEELDVERRGWESGDSM